MSPTILFDNTPEFSALDVVDPTIDMSLGVITVSVTPPCSLVVWFIIAILLSALLFVG